MADVLNAYTKHVVCLLFQDGGDPIVTCICNYVVNLQSSDDQVYEVIEEFLFFPDGQGTAADIHYPLSFYQSFIQKNIEQLNTIAVLTEGCISGLAHCAPSP